MTFCKSRTSLSKTPSGLPERTWGHEETAKLFWDSFHKTWAFRKQSQITGSNNRGYKRDKQLQLSFRNTAANALDYLSASKCWCQCTESLDLWMLLHGRCTPMLCRKATPLQKALDCFLTSGAMKWWRTKLLCWAMPPAQGIQEEKSKYLLPMF